MTATLAPDATTTEALLTTTTPQSHLLSFSEYASMYLYCWSDVLWPEELPDAETIWQTYLQARPSNKRDQISIAEKYREQNRNLQRFRARLPEVRRVLACCEVEDRGDGVAYFGMFAVEPALQAAGVGRAVLAAAEAYAAREWGSTTMEMTVIAQREELIAWYERRGYARTGETRPFPFEEMVGGGALRDDLHFVVLAKPLDGVHSGS